MPLVLKINCKKCGKNIMGDNKIVRLYAVYETLKDGTEKFLSHPCDDMIYYEEGQERDTEVLKRGIGVKTLCYNKIKKEMIMIDLKKNTNMKNIVMLDHIDECECPYCGAKAIVASMVGLA